MYTSIQIEPNTQKFLNAVAAAGGPPIYKLSPKDARNVLAGANTGNARNVPADSVDTTFPVGPTGTVKVRIVRPQGAKETLPAVMYFHGGGWVLAATSRQPSP